MNCKYTRPTVSYDGKYWYLSVGIEQESINIKLNNKTIGIDVGIKELAVTSVEDLRFENINKTKKVKK